MEDFLLLLASIRIHLKKAEDEICTEWASPVRFRFKMEKNNWKISDDKKIQWDSISTSDLKGMRRNISTIESQLSGIKVAIRLIDRRARIEIEERSKNTS